MALRVPLLVHPDSPFRQPSKLDAGSDSLMAGLLNGIGLTADSGLRTERQRSAFSTA
jgi:hypothetical protein